MKLYFRNDKELVFLFECETEELCYRHINKFLEDRDYKSYYSRSWVNEDGIKIIDVGSHYEFFEIHR